MPSKTYDQLSAVTTADNSDLLALYPTGGPLKVIAWLNVIAQLIIDLTPTFLRRTQNLADLNSAGVARTNLGLGTAATKDTGTTSGTVPLLSTGGKMPISTIADAGNMIVQLQQPNGSASADTPTAGSWTKRALNTATVNTVAGASLASSQITLPAGTYRFSAEAPTYSVISTSPRMRARLYDVTNSAVIHQGPNAFGPNSGSLNDINWYLTPTVDAVATFAGVTVIELQTFCGTAMGVYPPVTSGEVEVYNEVIIERLA